MTFQMSSRAKQLSWGIEGFRHGYKKWCIFISITNLTAKILQIFNHLHQAVGAAIGDLPCPSSTGAKSKNKQIIK